MLDRVCLSNCWTLPHIAGCFTGFLNNQVQLYDARKTKNLLKNVSYQDLQRRMNNKILQKEVVFDKQFKKD